MVSLLCVTIGALCCLMKGVPPHVLLVMPFYILLLVCAPLTFQSLLLLMTLIMCCSLLLVVLLVVTLTFIHMHFLPQWSAPQKEGLQLSYCAQQGTQDSSGWPAHTLSTATHCGPHPPKEGMSGRLTKCTGSHVFWPSKVKCIVEWMIHYVLCRCVACFWRGVLLSLIMEHSPSSGLMMSGMKINVLWSE